MNIKFVYFDVGNVLFSFDKAIEDLAKLSELSLEEVSTIWLELEEKICKDQVDPQAIWREVKKKAAYKGEDIDFIGFWTSRFAPIEKGHKLLLKTAEKYPVGLLTNIYKGTLEIALRDKIVPNINYKAIIQSWKIGAMKPEKEIFEYAEEACGYKGKEILFIDDNNDNVTGAKKFGWSGIVFDRNVKISSWNPH